MPFFACFQDSVFSVQILLELIHQLTLFSEVYRMDSALTHLVAKMEQLHNNRDDADITLYCEEETIKAHSFILELRWE